MNTDNQNDVIGKIINEANNYIQPQDSWDALKSRIDKRVFDKKKSSLIAAPITGNATFWRRMALTLAACLVVMTGLFIYFLYGSPCDRPGQIKFANQWLLNQNQLEQLNTAFSHVQELFGASCPWMVIDSGGQGQIGVGNQIKETPGSPGIIVIRLAVNLEGQKLKKRYFDVVTYPNQQADFNMSVAKDSNLGISIKPFMTNDGRITVEIKTGPESGTKAGDVVTVVNDKFTSLARVKSDGNWIDIDAVGQVVSNI